MVLSAPYFSLGISCNQYPKYICSWSFWERMKYSLTWKPFTHWFPTPSWTRSILVLRSWRTYNHCLFAMLLAWDSYRNSHEWEVVGNSKWMNSWSLLAPIHSLTTFTLLASALCLFYCKWRELQLLSLFCQLTVFLHLTPGAMWHLILSSFTSHTGRLRSLPISALISSFPYSRVLYCKALSWRKRAFRTTIVLWLKKWPTPCTTQ